MENKYTKLQYKIWFHYNATIAECNNYIITPLVENLVTLGYTIKSLEGNNKHKGYTLEEFVNKKSKQYSKGNIIDEWLWKYPHLNN